MPEFAALVSTLAMERAIPEGSLVSPLQLGLAASQVGTLLAWVEVEV